MKMRGPPICATMGCRVLLMRQRAARAWQRYKWPPGDTARTKLAFIRQMRAFQRHRSAAGRLPAYFCGAAMAVYKP